MARSRRVIGGALALPSPAEPVITTCASPRELAHGPPSAARPSWDAGPLALIETEARGEACPEDAAQESRSSPFTTVPHLPLMIRQRLCLIARELPRSGYGLRDSRHPAV